MGLFSHHYKKKKKRKIFLKQVYKFSSPSVLDPKPIPNIHRSKENIGNSHSIFFQLVRSQGLEHPGCNNNYIN